MSSSMPPCIYIWILTYKACMLCSSEQSQEMKLALVFPLKIIENLISCNGIIQKFMTNTLDFYVVLCCGLTVLVFHSMKEGLSG